MITRTGTCPTCGYKQKRSNQANRRHWALMHLISENIRLETGTFSPESWHKYFCMRFIGCEEFRLPSGEIILQPIGSSSLDVAQFNVFTTNAEVWAAEQGVYLPDLEEAA